MILSLFDSQLIKRSCLYTKPDISAPFYAISSYQSTKIAMDTLDLGLLSLKSKLNGGLPEASDKRVWVWVFVAIQKCTQNNVT